MEIDRSMNRAVASYSVVVAFLLAPGCQREPQGPILAGGREVKSWVADLHNPKPQVRRVAVLKLGNVGDTDPAVPEALALALRDSDRLVRRDAILAVAKLTRPGEALLAQLKSMSQSDQDPQVREAASRAIAHFEKAN